MEGKGSLVDVCIFIVSKEILLQLSTPIPKIGSVLICTELRYLEDVRDSRYSVSISDETYDNDPPSFRYEYRTCYDREQCVGTVH